MMGSSGQGYRFAANHAFVHTMFTTYEDSVLEHADDHGNLDINDACQLFVDHQALLGVYVEDTGDNQFNAEKMLAWLGY